MGFGLGLLIGFFVGSIAMFLICYLAITDEVTDDEKELWSKY